MSVALTLMLLVAPATVAEAADGSLEIARFQVPRQTRVNIANHGLLVKGRCTSACSLRLKIVLLGKDARRLHLGHGDTKIASGRGPVSADTSKVRAKVYSRPLKVLRRSGMVHVIVFLRGVAPDGTKTPDHVIDKLIMKFPG